MIRLVVHIVLLIILAVFISFNAPYRTSVNLFGLKQVDNISVIVVILLSVVLGVLYSFFVYLSSAVVRARRGRMLEREVLTRQQAQELQREREAGAGAPPAGAAPYPQAPRAERDTPPPHSPGRGPGGRAGRPRHPS